MEKIKKNEKWHCGVRAGCYHRNGLGAWLHLLFSGVKFKNKHTRPFLRRWVDFNACSYCKKKRGEVRLEFSWKEGAICENCSDQWHLDHPKALSKKDTAMLLNIVGKRNKSA